MQLKDLNLLPKQVIFQTMDRTWIEYQWISFHHVTFFIFENVFAF